MSDMSDVFLPFMAVKEIPHLKIEKYRTKARLTDAFDPRTCSEHTHSYSIGTKIGSLLSVDIDLSCENACLHK